MTLSIEIKEPFSLFQGPSGAALSVPGSITVNGTVISAGAGGGLDVSGGGDQHPDLDHWIAAWGEDSNEAVAPLDLTRVTIPRTEGTRQITAQEHEHLMRLVRRHYAQLFAFQPDHESYDDTQNEIFARYPESELNAAEIAAATRQIILEEVSRYLANAWLELQFFRQAAPTVALRAGRSPRNYGHILTELRRLDLLVDAG